MTRLGGLVVISDYFGGEGAKSGGAGHATLESVKALAAVGAEPRLIGGFHLPEHPPGPADLLGGEDLRGAAGFGRLKGVFNPDSRARLARSLDRLDPDGAVIILHQWTRFLTPSAMDLLSRFRLMIYMHDYFWLCPNGAYYDFRSGQPCTLQPMGLGCLTTSCDKEGAAAKAFRIARHAMKTLLAGADASRRVLVHISERSREAMAPIAPRERHEVVYNPLPAEVLAAADARPEPGEPPFDVGYFGRMEPEKGVLDLQAAVAKAGLRALYVGEGSLRAGLQAQGGGDFRPWASHQEALRLMRRCRVVVLPSRWPETWGLVVPEAMAQGTPVVVSSQAGSAELVTRHGGGMVFDPARPGALDAALKAVLEQGPPLRRNTAAGAVRRTLSADSHGGRILDIARARWGVDLAHRPAA